MNYVKKSSLEKTQTVAESTDVLFNYVWNKKQQGREELMGGITETKKRGCSRSISSTEQEINLCCDPVQHSSGLSCSASSQVFPRLMGSNSCFSEIIADVFPPWHRVNTHLDAAEQQTDRTSAFIELLTLTQLISALISSSRLLLTHLTLELKDVVFPFHVTVFMI